MEQILIAWLGQYTGAGVNTDTRFDELNFDLFDEAVTVDFVQKQFNINVNKTDNWFNSVKDLIDAITTGS